MEFTQRIKLTPSQYNSILFSEAKIRIILFDSQHLSSIVDPNLDGLAQNEEQDKQLKRLIATVPMGRRGSPDEVAKVVLFLASD